MAMERKERRTGLSSVQHHRSVSHPKPYTDATLSGCYTVVVFVGCTSLATVAAATSVANGQFSSWVHPTDPSHHHHLPTPACSLHSPAVRRVHRPRWRRTDRWKARGRRRGMDGRQERERCDPHSRAWSIYSRKCPNWQTAGRATAPRRCLPPCPSPPPPCLLLVCHLLRCIVPP